MEHAKPELVATEIQWPCPLQDETKRRLLAIAQPYDDKRLTGPMPGVFYVASGCLVGYATNMTADNSLGLIFGHGRWFGIQSIDNPEYSANEFYEALLPTQLWLFPRQDLERLMAQEAEIYKFLFYIAQQVGRMTLQLGSNTLFSLTTRVSYLLLELAHPCHPSADSQTPVIQTTQQTLSQIAGISRPRVNEVLKMLSEAGEIAVRRGEIQLLNIAALKARLPDLNFMYHDPLPHIERLNGGRSG